MSKKANPAVIGAFVIGALALATVAVVILGGGRWLTPKNRFVLYFEGSVAGLQLGAPVDFQGVKIGSVADVLVELDSRDTTVRTPVFVEIEPRRISQIQDDGIQVPLTGSPERVLARLVERGLRARLRTVSLVTGQVVVEFGFHPETPIQLSGIEHPVPELPTVPSPFEEFANKIAELPLEDLTESLLSTVQKLEEILSQPEIRRTPGLLNEMLTDARGLIVHLDERLVPMTESLEGLPATAEATLEDVRTLVRSTDERTAVLLADLEETSRAARKTLEQVESTFEGLDRKGAELQYDLEVTLGELAEAARSLRRLADTLEQQPESLLRGKRGG